MKTKSDCLKTSSGSAVLPKPRIGNSKSKLPVPCVNKPIFKRKLIEKYSTTRYNINTKRLSVRNSSASRTPSDDKFTISPENASSRIDNDEETKTSPVNAAGSSNKASTTVSSPIKSWSKNLRSRKKSESIPLTRTKISNKTPRKKDSSLPPALYKPQVTSNKLQDSQISRIKSTSTPMSSSSKTTWKIAPKIVYNQLSDLYHGAVEIKTEEEPTRELRKRPNCTSTRKRIPKKTYAIHKKVSKGTHFDPYIECLKNEVDQPDSSIGQTKNKFGIVMYLGVDRPLFPLVYRNLRVLNNSNDATVTAFWAEFSLSTLVTKAADKKCKPILVPVRDPNLHAMVSEYAEEVDVSSAASVINDDVVKTEVISPVCVKQEENDEVPEKKCKYKLRSSLNNKSKTPNDYELLANPYKNFAKKEPVNISDIKPTTSTRSRKSVENKTEENSEIKSTTSTRSRKLPKKEPDVKLATRTRSRKFIEKESERISEIEPVIRAEIKAEEYSNIEPEIRAKSEKMFEIEPAIPVEKISERISEIEPISAEKISERISEIEPISVEEISERISEIEQATPVEKISERISEIEPISAEKISERISEIKSISAEEISERISEIEPATLADRKSEKISNIEPTTPAENKSEKISDIEPSTPSENISEEIVDIKPTTSSGRKSRRKRSVKIYEFKRTISTRRQKLAEQEAEKISDVKPAIPAENECKKISHVEPATLAEKESEKTGEFEPVPITEIKLEINSDVEPITPRSFGPAPKSSPKLVPIHPDLTRTPPLTPIPATTLSPILTPNFTSISTPTSIESSIPTHTPASEPTLSPATASPNSKLKPKNRAIRTKKPVPEEKKTPKKSNPNDCLVTIPKLSDTLIKYLSAGNYSNESAELSDPTERELIEETDDFGLIQCTRTDGIIIDYLKRNRSMVYFYKLKKMLDFQKTNNKYFVHCNYMLIDRSDVDEDEMVDITSTRKDDNRGKSRKNVSAESERLRSSKNPNDLFVTSKISEWKNKSNRISWVKNHDLKFVSDVKWLLISFDKNIGTLSHATGCLLRHRLLFEIIYRAELSKKVICCEMLRRSGTSASDADTDSVDEKLPFGIYAFPGLCDRIVAGPFLPHEDHQFSASVRTKDGSFELAYIRTLEEKENFPQSEDSTSVKYVNAKWWTGKETGDMMEQYLNFFFNPTAMKCTQLPDKLCLNKIIDEHPCHNYHSYEIKSKESNLVLFHDGTNAIERTCVSSTKPSGTVEIDNKTDRVSKVARPIPPKSSINLRNKPRRDYSRLLTDDMGIPAKTNNLGFHIVNVKSLRKRRDAQSEAEPKPKRSRYQESPESHILNERIRRKEFRDRKNDLISILEARSLSGSSVNSQSLISILNQAKEFIAYLEMDNRKLDEEAKRLLLEQNTMIRKFLVLTSSFDINSETYKKGERFMNFWKKITAEGKKRVPNVTIQNTNKPKTNKTAESSRIQVNIEEPTSIQRPVSIHSNRPSILGTSIPENRTVFRVGPYGTLVRADNQLSEVNLAQRSKFRKQKRQNMRNELSKRIHSVETRVAEPVECEFSAEVVCENGKLSDPFGSNHIIDGRAEVPIIIPNTGPHAVDPLASDSDDVSHPPGGYSTAEKKPPPHPLYVEHSYCSNEDEPAKPSLPRIKTVFSQKPGYHSFTPSQNCQRGSNINRPSWPNINDSASSPKRPYIRRTPAAVTPPFDIRERKLPGGNLAVDLLHNGERFAILNIAKINNGKANNAASSNGAGARSTDGAIGAATSNALVSTIRRFLMRMGTTTPAHTAQYDERIKQAQRKYVVNSLNALISKFESRRQSVEDSGYSSSHTSNSNNTSPANVTDSIEIESGYSSRSEESSDRDLELTNKALRNRCTEGQIIENIVIDDDDEIESQELVQVEPEPVVIHIPEPEEQIFEDEFIVEEEEEEELICEEEIMDEEEEEESSVGSSFLEEMNDVDAAMRGSQVDRFTDSEDSTESAASFVSDNYANMLDLRTDRLAGREEGSLLKPMSNVFKTNQFSIIRSKDKFVPNIMKTQARAVDSTFARDHLSRIKVKPSVGLVKMSTDRQLRSILPCTTTSSGSNDFVFQRSWYSPVLKTNQDQKVPQESSPDKLVKIGDLQSERLADSNKEKELSIEKNNGSRSRILIKSFANHDKFKEAFVSNVDKLLKPLKPKL